MALLSLRSSGPSKLEVCYGYDISIRIIQVIHSIALIGKYVNHTALGIVFGYLKAEKTKEIAQHSQCHGGLSGLAPPGISRTLSAA